MKTLLLLACILFCSCASKVNNDPSSLVSVQVIDRNGFSETISSKDRLATYQRVDFLSSQPYQKVLRIYGRDQEGKSASKITSYHSNGSICQYLEVADGRAHGIYKEWHPNGRLKMETSVIEGIADIHPLAQSSWIFDGKSCAWDEEGHSIAEFQYEKGMLEDASHYYHPNGQLAKVVPYTHHEIHGAVMIYDHEGTLLESIPFSQGLREGIAQGFWRPQIPWYREEYQQGMLQHADYFDLTGKLVAEIKQGNGFQAIFEDHQLYSLVEHQNGKPQGTVNVFATDGSLQCTYHIKDGKKHGEEWEYYPSSTQPRLYLNWHEDVLQGIVKTWYEEGIQESQREMSNNKKHGVSFAWFKNSQVMLMEEYENDILTKGSYFKKGDKNPVSKIEHGKGMATLYSPEGFFLKKITYEKGRPLLDSSD